MTTTTTTESPRYFAVGKRPESPVRDSTPEEVAEALSVQARREEQQRIRTEATKELARLSKGCTHPVCEDIAGYPYDSRVCVRCGDHLGLI